MTGVEKKEIEEIEEMASIMCGQKRTCQDCLRGGIRLGFAFNCECLLYAEKVYKKGYRLESETVKQFAEKVNEVIEACERQDGYDAEGSPIYTIDTAILRVEMEQIAEQYGKEEDTI